MNVNLEVKVNNDSDNDFLNLINKSVFRKTLNNVSKQREIKLVSANRKRIRLAEPSYHTIKRFLEKSQALEINKTELKMNISVYLGLLILDMS